MSDGITVTDGATSTPPADSSTTPSTSIQRPQPQPPQPQPQEQLTRAVTPSRSPSLPMFEFDPRNVLNQLSPAQFQQLFASLASQNLLDPTTTSSVPPSASASTNINPNATNLNTGSNLMPYHQQQPFDFSLQQPTSNFAYPFFPPEALIPFESYDSSSSSNGASAGANGAAGLGDMDLALLNSPSSQEQREHEEKMTKQWESAGVIEDDLNGVHSRIHSLAEAFGLDPVLLDNGLSDHAVGVENGDDNNDSMDGLQMGLQGQQQQQQSTSTTTAASGTNTGVEGLPTPSPTTTSGAAATADFDFDSFFNNLSSSTAGLGTDLDSGMDYTSTAFLDEVPTPASSSDQTASPVLSLRQEVVPEVSGVGPAKGTRKRKSDVAIDLDIPGTAPLSTTIKTTSGGGGKSKRRRDK